MKASVIIPTYNQITRLMIVLKAFNDQITGEEFEVIVIDDGYTELIEDEINEVKKNYPFVFERLKENSGRSIARNRGVELAKGELLIFCDSDRIPDNNFVQKHISRYIEEKKKHEDFVIVGKIVETFLPGFDMKWKKYYDNFDLNKVKKHGRYFNYYDYIEMIYNSDGETTSNVPWVSLFTSNFSISKSLFCEIGGFDETFKQWGFENFELGYRLHDKGVKFVLEREAINFLFFHKADRTGSRRDDSMRVFYQKYEREEIKNLLSFLDGDISYELFESISSGKELMQGVKETFFMKNVLGKRYEE